MGVGVIICNSPRDSVTKIFTKFVNNINVPIMKKACLFAGLILFGLSVCPSFAQLTTPDEVRFYTAEWEGERYPDGRPRVTDELLDRILKISIEEAWGVMRGEGYHNQFAGDWKMVHADRPFVGRALTAVYIPESPELKKRRTKAGHEAGMIGAMNSWPIDMLNPGDVYVADCFGKVIDGTLIGDNLAHAIYVKSGTGVVFDASLRDLEGIESIDGFNAYVRGWNPTYLKDVMLTGINVPIRIGEAVVLPGDIVLAKREGVIFIPPHRAEKVAITAEYIMLRDKFGHQRLKEGIYTPGQIDSRWTDEIKQDFLQWLDENPDLLPMSREELDEFMKNRTW